jgi:3-methyl-2-oxobutanoate hydroxymethyltransferase
MERKKVTIQDLLVKKERGEKILRVVCYDYAMALLVDRAAIDSILVGDSLAMIMLGMNSTMPVTMEEMIHHCKAVTRAVKYALVIGDMPFLSYQTSISDAIHNAGRLMKEGHVDAVKLEGGLEIAPTVKAIVDAGIPVAGHIGFTPQTVSKLSGWKVQGRDAAGAKKLIDDALALEEAGAFIISLEFVPDRLARAICEKLAIPATGIGSGPYTDGQSLLLYDMIGLFDRPIPKYAKKYANTAQVVLQVLESFKKEVEERSFPGPEHGFHIEDEVLKEIIKE